MTGHSSLAAALSRCANVVLPAPPQPSMPTRRTDVVVVRISSTSCAYVRIAAIHTSVAHQRFSSYLGARIHAGGARRLCEVIDCDRQVYCKGLCEPHYRRMRRTGTARDELPIGARPASRLCMADDCERLLRNAASATATTCA